MEATSCPARNQPHENRVPLFNKPSRWSLRTSRLRHSSVVVFLPKRCLLPDPRPPKFFHPSLFAEIISKFNLLCLQKTGLFLLTKGRNIDPGFSLVRKLLTPRGSR